MSQLLKELNEKLNDVVVLELMYRKELQKLPRGTIVCKEIKEEKYYYLSYRYLNKIKTKYLGKQGVYDPTELQAEVELRQHTESMLKQLKFKREELQAAIKAVEKYNNSHGQSFNEKEDK